MSNLWQILSSAIIGVADPDPRYRLMDPDPTYHGKKQLPEAIFAWINPTNVRINQKLKDLAVVANETHQ